jgi:exodeoxyribonuclease VII large subunit
MAVPVRTELLGQTLDLQRRMLRCFSVGMERRRETLRHVARVLPRADQLFAQQRQRYDVVAERLTNALRRNVEAHRRAYIETAAQLRPAGLLQRMAQYTERVHALSLRIHRCQQAKLSEAAGRLEGLVRVLDSVSHRAVLARGFALVRGADGTLRRQAAGITRGESLSLTFGDGTVAVIAGEGAGPPPLKSRSAGKKPSGNQGDLF